MPLSLSGPFRDRLTEARSSTGTTTNPNVTTGVERPRDSRAAGRGSGTPHRRRGVSPGPLAPLAFHATGVPSGEGAEVNPIPLARVCPADHVRGGYDGCP